MHEVLEFGFSFFCLLTLYIGYFSIEVHRTLGKVLSEWL